MAHSTPSGKRPATLSAVAVLLIAALIDALWVPIYARVTPKLGPFPFFYWYQLVLVPAVSVVTWICYLLLRARPARDSRPWDGAGGRR